MHVLKQQPRSHRVTMPVCLCSHSRMPTRIRSSVEMDCHTSNPRFIGILKAIPIGITPDTMTNFKRRSFTESDQ